MESIVVDGQTIPLDLLFSASHEFVSRSLGDSDEVQRFLIAMMEAGHDPKPWFREYVEMSTEDGLRIICCCCVEIACGLLKCRGKDPVKLMESLIAMVKARRTSSHEERR